MHHEVRPLEVVVCLLSQAIKHFSTHLEGQTIGCMQYVIPYNSYTKIWTICYDFRTIKCYDATIFFGKLESPAIMLRVGQW